MVRLLLLTAFLASTLTIGLFALPTSGGAGKNQKQVATFKQNIVPFLAKHCYECHGNGKKKAGLALDKYTDDASLMKDRAVWENVVNLLQTGEMPPKERPRPKVDDMEAVVKAIDDVINYI